MAKRRSYYGQRKTHTTRRLFLTGMLITMVAYGSYVWFNNKKAADNIIDPVSENSGLDITSLEDETTNPVESPTVPITVVNNGNTPSQPTIEESVAIEPVKEPEIVEIPEKLNPSPEPSSNAIGLYEKAVKSFNDKYFVTARKQLSDAIDLKLPAKLEKSARDLVNKASDQWLFSKNVFSGDQYCENYLVDGNLSAIAPKYDITSKFIMRINNIKDDRKVPAGKNIKVVQGPFHVIVRKTKFELSVYIGQNAEMLVRTYPVTIGKPGRDTPTGHWTVSLKQEDPAFPDRENNIVYSSNDPKNPLGERWIALKYDEKHGGNNTSSSTDGIGIHGTIEENLIGTAASRGCIRMKNKDVEELYDMLLVGKSRVQIID
ncbi:MAG: L,D-transpeptidase family protein [Phycisphaerae bacterium]|nr:L,D-transpeptidase family protein [Phycisphaerae bacterium]